MALLTTEVIDPHTLRPDQRERFTDELYAAHDRIFCGVSREAFAAYVVDSPAGYTRIEVYRSGSEIVGYAAFHAFERIVEERPNLILRAEVGLLPAYRRQSHFGGFLLREALKALIRSPGTKVWGLSCATNPATYRTVSRHADQVWPHWERPTPAPLEQLMTELAEQFGLRPVDPARPGVYHVGWQTRQSDTEAQRWQDCDHPASRLYVQRNPGYTEGHGLLLLVPLTPVGIVRAFARMLFNKLRRRVDRTRRALVPQTSEVSSS